MLAQRLARRGLALPVGTLAAVLSQKAASAAVPTWLVISTVKAATIVAAGGAAASVVSAGAAALIERGARAMFLARLKIATLFLMVAGVLAAGLGAFSQPALPERQLGAAPRGKAPAGKGGEHAGKPQPAEKWQVRATLREPKVMFVGVAFSPDGNTVATPCLGGDVLLWDVARHEVRAKFTSGHRGRTSVAFSPDSKIIASTGAEGVVKLWDAETGKERTAWKHLEIKEVKVEREVTGGGSQLAFSPDGKSLAVACENLVRILDVSTGKEQATLEGHTDRINTLAYALGGKVLVTGSTDRTVKVWDLTTARERATLQGPADGQIALSPDGKTLATYNSQDKPVTLSLWDVATGFEKATWKGVGREGEGLRLAFSPDGKTLAAGTRPVRVLDRTSGKVLDTLKTEGANPSSASAMAFSPNGRILAATGYEVELPSEDYTGVLYLWELRK
jgi:WD40 repeat protein